MEKCGLSQGLRIEIGRRPRLVSGGRRANSLLEIIGREPLRGSGRGPIHRVEHPSDYKSFLMEALGLPSRNVNCSKLKNRAGFTLQPRRWISGKVVQSELLH